MPLKLKENNDIYMLIAKNIKKYRKEKNLTQKELAKLCGYSYSYIRKIEGPKCPKTFSVLTLYNISSSLNIDIKYMFESNDI